jgi:predicted RNA-binding protein Jag
MMKIKSVTIIVSALVMVSLVGCGKRNEELKNSANEIVEAFNYLDMDLINSVIFNTSHLKVDDELAEYFPEKSENSWLMSEIFSLDKVKVQKIDEKNDSIIYTIEAPDLSDIFLEISDDADNMTEKEFERYVMNYIKEADKVTATVSVDYSYDGKEYYINYQNEEFLDAITGGLLNAYQTLYQKMLDEYLQKMEESE